MGDTKANLIITDPPYNVNYEGSAGKIKNDNMASEKFYQFLLDAFSCMESVLADDGSIYVFHADTESLNFRRAFADARVRILSLVDGVGTHDDSARLRLSEDAGESDDRNFL